MTKTNSLFRLWRNRGGFYQIRGQKDVRRPANTPVRLPKRQLSREQR